MISDYEASADFARLRPHTQRVYQSSLRRLRLVFGTVAVRDWVAAWGQHYLAERRATPAGANHDLGVLSVVFAIAVREGVLNQNPCRDVRRHPSRPRDRYVDDRELATFRRYCSPRANAYLDLKLSTGARQGQLAVVRWSDWDGETLTLFIKAAKGGKDTRYGGPGVREALGRCALAFHGLPLESAAALEDRCIVVTRAGRAYKSAKHMVKSLWHPAMRRYAATGAARFHEHDLRAKVASDSPNLSVAQERLGHQTSTITQRVYRRAPRVVESVDIRRSRQPDLFDETMGGLAPSSDTSSAKSPARSKAAVAARRAKPPANRMGGPAVSVPQVAARGPRGLKPPGRAARKPDRRRDAGGPARASE